VKFQLEFIEHRIHLYQTHHMWVIVVWTFSEQGVCMCHQNKSFKKYKLKCMWHVRHSTWIKLWTFCTVYILNHWKRYMTSVIKIILNNLYLSFFLKFLHIIVVSDRGHVQIFLLLYSICKAGSLIVTVHGDVYIENFVHFMQSNVA
jgi:hypothetical protein